MFYFKVYGLEVDCFIIDNDQVIFLKREIPLFLNFSKITKKHFLPIENTDLQISAITQQY